MIDSEKLSAPFDPSKISWRVGSTMKDKSKGMALAYIDARDVMARLDEVVGANSWGDSYRETPSGRMVCTIDIWDEDRAQWVGKSDGAGDTAVEGEKGAVSDAFKRAAVKWGIGRYLYDVDSPWVELEVRGNSRAIKKSEQRKLNAALGGAGSPTPRPTQKPEPAKAPAETTQPTNDQALVDAVVRHAKALDFSDKLKAWVSNSYDGRNSKQLTDAELREIPALLTAHCEALKEMEGTG